MWLCTRASYLQLIVDENIGRLDITVSVSFGVEMAHSLDQLGENIRGVFRRHVVMFH